MITTKDWFELEHMEWNEESCANLLAIGIGEATGSVNGLSTPH